MRKILYTPAILCLTLLSFSYNAAFSSLFHVLCQCVFLCKNPVFEANKNTITSVSVTLHVEEKSHQEPTWEVENRAEYLQPSLSSR